MITFILLEISSYRYIIYTCILFFIFYLHNYNHENLCIDYTYNINISKLNSYIIQ